MKFCVQSDSCYTSPLVSWLPRAAKHPNFFKHDEQYRLLELEPASMEFYSIFGLTLMVGIFSTTLSLNQASRIINVNSPDPTYGLQEDF